MKKGDLFVISAPSGAGKTTLCKRVLSKFPHLQYSISFTTRQPRLGEVNGKDYNFVSEEIFKEMISRDEFVEWANVHGNYYGTSKKWLNDRLNEGKDILLDIDVQGAKQILKSFPEAVLIFILPPSYEELENRLKKRGTDSPEKIAIRLENAKREMKEIGIYHYAVINDDLEKASCELECIFTSVFCKTGRILRDNPHLIN